MNASPTLFKLLVVPAIALGLASVATRAEAPELAMLGKLQPGLWNLKERGSADASDKLCVRDLRKLLQLRHRDQQCSRFVVSDLPDEVTVTYRCPGGGSGRPDCGAEIRPRAGTGGGWCCIERADQCLCAAVAG